jgi:excisionase family DNA binding protein
MNQKEFIEIEQSAKELDGPAANIILTIANEVKELASKVGKAFYNVKEAAEYTGLSRQLIYKAVRNKEIAYSQPSGKGGSSKLFFKRSDLDAYLSRNYSPANADVEAEVANWI